MRMYLIAAAACAFMLGAVAPSHAQTAQQERMKTCNADAKTQALKGDARKSYMKSCLSGEAAKPAANSQQQKMKTCNADAKAKALKGAERKAFMKSCLSG